MLIPECLDPLVELLELGGHIGVAAFREAMPELDAAFAQPFDLVSDVLKCAHVQDKRETGPRYSALTSPTTSGTFVTSGQERGERGLHLGGGPSLRPAHQDEQHAAAESGDSDHAGDHRERLERDRHAYPSSSRRSSSIPK